MNGDGTGKALGVNDPILGAHLLGVFTTIWALYYIVRAPHARPSCGHQPGRPRLPASSPARGHPH